MRAVSNVLDVRLAALLALAACASDPAPEAPFEPLASYACEGGATVVIGEERARVLDGDDALRLRGQDGAFEGDGAQVSVRPGAVTLRRGGGAAVRCEPKGAMVGEVPPVVTAAGDAPDWGLVIEPERMRLTRDDGAPLTMPTPAPRRVGRIATWTAEGGGDALEARLSPGPCRATGALPTPLNAEVTANGRYYRGCSGEPADLLAGTWDVRGEGAAITFGQDGTVGLATGCNDPRGTFEVTDDALTFGPFRQTRMACPAPIMAAEDRLLGFLRRTDGFDIGEEGEVVLLADGESLLLVRQAR